MIKPVKFIKRDCTMHFCGRYRDFNPYGRPESKAFSNRTILKIISKIGTYSYCTPLLIDR
nr:MAG TPA: hypothetical protein [Bacteriophage sp.]DAM36270.1 MAG TPA: hypothetical protein [Caudoviricetes sp.]DAV93302.1 MAG TPA: hypothetical protein [Caudoviricetes sp.]